MIIAREQLKRNWELRAMAREQLKGNWGKAVLATFLYCIIYGVAGSIPLVNLVLYGPLALGFYIFFIRLAKREETTIENLFDGFKTFVPSMVLGLLILLFTFLWTLLLIIPGIIATLRYSMAFFIMHDNPGIEAMEALRRSKEMMHGQKGKLFLLYLSFIGWCLLAMLTLGIGMLWVTPYMQAALTNFYEDLKKNSLSSEIR